MNIFATDLCNKYNVAQIESAMEREILLVLLSRPPQFTQVQRVTYEAAKLFQGAKKIQRRRVKKRGRKKKQGTNKKSKSNEVNFLFSDTSKLFPLCFAFTRCFRWQSFFFALKKLNVASCHRRTVVCLSYFSANIIETRASLTRFPSSFASCKCTEWNILEIFQETAERKLRIRGLA